MNPEVCGMKTPHSFACSYKEAEQVGAYGAARTGADVQCGFGGQGDAVARNAMVHRILPGVRCAWRALT